MVGLGPSTATVDDLDQLGCFYRCRVCGAGGKDVVDWKLFIYHLYREHGALSVSEVEVQIITAEEFTAGGYYLIGVGPISEALP